MVIAAGVFNSGLLAAPHERTARYNHAPTDERTRDRACALATLCRRHGIGLKAAALQFPARHPAVTTMLMGARTLPELRESLALLSTPVPEALWAELDANASGDNLR